MENILPLTIKIMHSSHNMKKQEPTPGASSSPQFTEWKISDFEELTFESCLNRIRTVLGNNNATAFDYHDEDDDLITVRGDDELLAMLSGYCCMLMSRYDGDGRRFPLTLYPKICKQAVKKAKLAKLKVDLKDDEIDEPMEIEGSKKKSGNIEEILASGKVRDSDFDFITILGSGSCGAVYKAKHKTTGELAAVKVIPLDISREVQHQIISELDILHQCKSPVIISFFGAHFNDNKISMYTEYMDGGSLDMYMHIPESILGPISVSVVTGLQYLWSLKILHRDVKPSNILVNTAGSVKLCDFGISVQLIDSIAKSFIGTNAYMAPERIQGHDYSIHSEVWSVGVSLFELSSGHFPYKNSLNLWRSIVDDDPPQLDKSSFSEQFVDFVSKCMQKVPLMRPAPESLMQHPFIQMYVNTSPSLVAEWVVEQQRLIKLQQQHKQQQQ
ncbi:hypothetical protein HELRODRAFT_107285 [Helobdella robusta]|uniref:mitogen-activated protein kinase kinase n=1 Tax=Helobdella robusta TaxID=6412 RepID=T1EE93_HELRO|nr:hypothetical protein HELRODRAFT_107285 [Helobdella robusta]ESN96035.1 hypothetical protein HELRODRAFT_107285 [Helobdella robusta]